MTATTIGAPASATRPSVGSRLLTVLRAREFPVVAVLVIIVLVTTWLNPRFLTLQAIRDSLLATSFIALLAVGQTFVILMRHIDLSVGSTLGLASYTSALAAQAFPDAAVPAMLLVAAGTGLAVGVVNGAFVAFLRLPALVVTLGTLYVVQGIQALIVGPVRVNASDLPRSVIDLGLGTFLAVPYLMWFAIVAAIIATWAARSVRPLRDLYAMGSNPAAAELAGIPIGRRVMTAFMISGTAAGLGGALFLARFGGTDANAGIGLELSIVAACVIGGVFIFGGSGTPIGALFGALLLKVIGLSLIAVRVPEFWQRALVGFLLLAAITIDRVAQLRAERRLREESAR